jgi:peptidoglycan/xylan/chitin deacetylase (PgdA/CDA1 family)
MCVSPENFSNHLRLLTDNANVVPLSKIVEDLGCNSLTSNSVAITFDDGYSDFLSEAHPILEQFACPATLFVTAGAIDSKREFWWDELEALMLGGKFDGPLRLDLGKEKVEWLIPKSSDSVDLSAPALPAIQAQHESGIQGRLSVMGQIGKRVRSLPHDAQQEVLQQICDSIGSERISRKTHRALATDELKTVASSPLVEIGAHTWSHPVLSALPIEQQLHEIEYGAAELARILGSKPRHFAYPHGGRQDFSPETIRMVRKTNFQSACAAYPGVVTKRTNVHAIPRIGIGNWSSRKFSRALKNWFGV